MKIIRGLKIGGLQQKIFNLMLIIIAILIGIYTAFYFYQQKNLTQVVQEASVEQQASITAVSEETMAAVLNTSLSRTTALQAYIADDLFADVRTDVETLQAFATELFAHAESFSAHPFSEPDPALDGTPTVQMQHEQGVDPEASEDLGLVANMSEIMLAMFRSSNKLSSCFVATTDGCILYVDDRSGAYQDEDGQTVTFDVRSRPWYCQAVEEGDLIFTGVEADAFTDIPGLVCAAPVYREGKLVAVVGADIFLTSISDYVQNTSSESGYLCVISQDGQVLFSSRQEGVFKAELSSAAPDLRANENRELAAFIAQALQERTPLSLIEVDGKPCYLSGAPMGTLGWAVVSVVEKAVTDQPTQAMLQRYDEINDGALAAYESGATRSGNRMLIVLIVVFLLAVNGSLVLASRVVKPLEPERQRPGLRDGGGLPHGRRDRDPGGVLCLSLQEDAGLHRPDHPDHRGEGAHRHGAGPGHADPGGYAAQHLPGLPRAPGL